MDSDQEPDYRMSLAAERTYLAYLRTGLALMAAGVGVAGALPDADAKTFRRVIGLVLVIAGAGILAEARLRWRAVDRAMRQRQPLPSARPVVRWMSWLLAAAAVAAAVLVFVV